MANLKSSISFGLVNIPVVYNTIIKNNDTSFNQLHKKCLNRIQYQKYCSHCKKIVKEPEIVKGYEYAKEEYVTFTKEELTNFQIDLKGTIEIISFIPISEIPEFYYEKSYILTPPKKEKAFSLFLEILKKTKKAALAKTAINTKFYYVILTYFQGIILMSTLYFEEEINIPESVTSAKFTKEEFDLALKLVAHLEGHFKPESYRDEYQYQIKEAIKKKIDGEKLPKKKKSKTPLMKDLMTSLQKSLEEK